MQDQLRCNSLDNHRQQILPRRWFVSALGFGGLSVSVGRFGEADAAEVAADKIAQPSSPSDTAFIARAFEMRDLAVKKGDQPYGAIIVRDGRIIGQSWSRVILDQDPTAHAELAAIRDTARRLGNRNLGGAVMYSSSRPCPMCEAAAYWANVAQMIHGRAATDAGGPRLCR